MTTLELGANAFNAAAVMLAARNSVHTWWTGIVGCVLLGLMFLGTRLYADASLQIFFIVTSIMGWRAWKSGTQGHKPVTRISSRLLLVSVVVAIFVTVAYASALYMWTKAAAPLPDSAVLAFSVIAQVLLMQRRIETWWFWIVVDSIASPLYFSRGLWLTGALYAIYWVTCWLGYFKWRRELRWSLGT